MTLRRTSALLAGAGLSLTLLAYGGGGAAGTSAPDTSAVEAGDWEARWEALILAAQDEGEISIVLGPSVDLDRAVFEAFAEQFGLEVRFFGGDTPDVLPRISAERDQGIFDYDVAHVGATGMREQGALGFFTPLEPLLFHPDVLDRSTGWRIDYIPWVEAEHLCLNFGMSVEANIMSLWYNTDNVSQEEIDSVESWFDFLEPQWAGRFVIGDLGNGEQAPDRVAAWQVLGQEWFDTFLRDLEVEVLPYGSGRETADGLARGQWDLALFPAGEESLQEAREAGLPVARLDRTLAEGAPADGSARACVYDHAANPNAAQLFANWINTVEGQTAFNATILRDDRVALRSDVPQGNVPDEIWNLANEATTFTDENNDEYRADFEESEAYVHDLMDELGLNPGS